MIYFHFIFKYTLLSDVSVTFRDFIKRFKIAHITTYKYCVDVPPLLTEYYFYAARLFIL